MKRTAPLDRVTPMDRGSGAMKRGAPLPRSTGLRHRSPRMERIYRTLRRPLVAELAAEPSICPVPWCTRLADSPHEIKTRARGGSITDPANVVMVCHLHNEEISATEPDWAYDLGLLKHSWEA